MASSSLSSVVSGLVRASMGTSIPPTVQDDDLDRAVAELIVREAKKKAERYSQQGIRAYISSNLTDSNAPKPNKRFLSSIIKSTDDHNKTILKAQAQAAQEIKREREEQERRQRRARAEEASQAAKQRSTGRGSKRKSSKDEEWDRWDGRTAERKKVSRNWESWDGRDDASDNDRHRKRRRTRSRSVSRERDKTFGSSSRAKRSDDREDEDRSRRRGRSRSASPRRRKEGSRERQDDDLRRPKRRRTPERSHRHSHRSPSPSLHREESLPARHKRSPPKYALDDIHNDSSQPSSRRSPSPPSDSGSRADRRSDKVREAKLRSPSPRRKSSAKARAQDDPEPVASTSKQSPARDDSDSGSRSPSPGPHPALQLPSKMDRYFEESYDPRLDVEPLTAPTVPATGLINNAEFEGWDAMLELIRIRREDKEEKKRLERLGLLPPKEKGKSKKKAVVADYAPAVADRWSGDGAGIMDIEYTKRGSVREWDMGKEGF